MGDNNLCGEFSATVWAEEFMRVYELNVPKSARDACGWINVDSMRGWFANAIMAGYDRANQEKAGSIERVGVEELAKFMHVEYEKQAIKVGWNTQDSCKVDFDDLPEKNKQVMLAVAKAILNNLKEKE